MVSGDLHLSAEEITPSLIKHLESLGFRRDEFANNTRCEAAAYHATYRGEKSVPDTQLWHEVTSLLNDDPSFIGCLEEEIILPDERLTFSHPQSALPINAGSLRHASVQLERVEPEIYKACDIHLSISLEHSSKEAVEAIEALQLVAFDKPTQEGIRRVYTLTCESIEDGKTVYDLLRNLLPRLAFVSGKLKMERTTKYLRKPSTASCLPLLSRANTEVWRDTLSQILDTSDAARLESCNV